MAKTIPSAKPETAFVSRNLVDFLPMPVIELDKRDRVSFANAAAEQFLGLGRQRLHERQLSAILPPGSPLMLLIEHVRSRGGSISEYGIELAGSRAGRPDQIADIFASPLGESGEVLLLIQPRALLDKMNRQLNSRDSVRSVSAMGAMLAHEIKNPLSGIRGAAQLLERSVPEADRPLSTLIREEVDRIVRLVDRFEMFSDGRPLPVAPLNVHEVLDHVMRLAQSGFAGHIRFRTDYDPSLPPISGNKDRLVQAFLNLVKNAAEAIGTSAMDGCITLSTAFRPGVSVQVPSSGARLSLPFEVLVSDNGPGIPDHLMPHLFEPFVTSKASGNGLGLALVGKVISDHGGVIEHERVRNQTIFRVLLPLYRASSPV